MKSNFKTITAIFLGSILEWYDFGLFIFLMPTISVIFFPNHTHYISIIFGYSILAISYLIRPLGGLIFGYLGDRFNKSNSLVLTLVLMSLPSLLIGLLPSYQQIGLLAPLILILLRLIQGLSAGGELIGAITLTYEISRPPYRNALSCLVWTGSGAGMLLASLCVTSLLHFVDKQAFIAWVWRIPFFFGAALGLVAFYLRRSYLRTSVSKDKIPQEKNFLINTLLNYKHTILYFIVLFSPVACIFYLGFFYMPVYASQVGTVPYTKALNMNIFMMLCLQIFPVISGYLMENSSKIPWTRVNLAALILLPLPVYYLITQNHLFYFLAAQFCFALVTSMYASATMLTALEKAPPHARYTIMALSYNISYAIFGNALPLVTIYFMFKWHYWLLPGVIISATCLLSGLCLLLKKIYQTIPNSPT